MRCLVLLLAAASRAGRLAQRRGFFELHLDLALEEGQVLFVTRDYRIDEDVAALCASVAPGSTSCAGIAAAAAKDVLDRCLYLIHLGTDDGRASCKWAAFDEEMAPEAESGGDDLVSVVDAYETGPGVEKYRHYFEVYERFLARFRNTRAVMLEIGIADGGSSVIWRRWLGPDVELHCADINPRCVAGDDGHPRTTTHHGDQADAGFLGRVLAATSGPLDVVLDDGGHSMDQQISTFEVLYPRLAPGGVYVVEDCHTSYWPSFGGDGYGGATSFVDYAKHKIDALHYFRMPRTGAAIRRLSEADVAFAAATKAISVFESVVVFEKHAAPITAVDLAPAVRGSVFTPGVGQRGDGTHGIGGPLYEPAAVAPDGSIEELKKAPEPAAAAPDGPIEELKKAPGRVLEVVELSPTERLTFREIDPDAPRVPKLDDVLEGKATFKPDVTVLARFSPEKQAEQFAKEKRDKAAKAAAKLAAKQAKAAMILEAAAKHRAAAAAAAVPAVPP